MTGRRLLLALTLASPLAAAAVGCGFGRADDSGKPIPGPYWGWACPDGGAPDAAGGCPIADAGVDTPNDAGDARGDGPPRDR